MLDPFVILSSLQVRGEILSCFDALVNIRGKWSGSFSEILVYRWLCTSYSSTSRSTVHRSTVMEHHLVQPLLIKLLYFVVFLNKVAMRSGEVVELHLFFLSFSVIK